MNDGADTAREKPTGAALPPQLRGAGSAVSSLAALIKLTPRVAQLFTQITAQANAKFCWPDIYGMTSFLS